MLATLIALALGEMGRADQHGHAFRRDRIAFVDQAVRRRQHPLRSDQAAAAELRVGLRVRAVVQTVAAEQGDLERPRALGGLMSAEHAFAGAFLLVLLGARAGNAAHRRGFGLARGVLGIPGLRHREGRVASASKRPRDERSEPA